MLANLTLTGVDDLCGRAYKVSHFPSLRVIMLISM